MLSLVVFIHVIHMLPFFCIVLAVVKDAWAGNESHVLVSKIGPYKLYYWDIKQIGPNMELESEV